MMQDIRHALRLMGRQKAFTAAALVTLALGIGATTAIFSIVYGVLLRPLPYPDADRLVRVFEEHPGAVAAVRTGMLSNYTFHGWRDAPGVLEGLGAFRNHPYTLREGGGAPSRVAGADVSPELFRVLGARPAAGRLLQPDDEIDGAPGVVVLSWSFWQERFGGETSAIGRTMALDGEPSTIVGVVASGFYFPDRNVRLWKPLQVELPDPKRQRTGIYSVIGRLRSGITAEQAAAEGTSRARAAGPRPMSADLLFGRGGPVEVRIRPLLEDITARVQPALLLLLGAVGAVLLIACVNVANLLLARGVARQRELAVRAAVGAGRRRLVRQLMTESLVLSVLGGVLGIGVGWAMVRLVPVVAPLDFPRLADVRLDRMAVLFAAAATLAAGLLSGALPAVRLARGRLLSPLREGAGASGSVQARRLGATLLVVEAALALVLLVGAGLLALSFTRLLQVDAGYDIANVLLARVYPENEDVPVERTRAFMGALLDRLRASPGVVHAGIGSMLPFQPTMGVANVRLEHAGPDGKPAVARAIFYLVTPGYAEALGLRLRQGRTFRNGDLDAGIRPVLINEHFARAHFADGRPIVGRRLLDWGDQQTEIIGVVGNMLKDGPDTQPQNEVYHVASRHFQVQPWFSIVVRTSSDPMALVPQLRAIVRELEPSVALDDVGPMAGRVSASVAQPRFAMSILVAFAVVALTLAAVGLYGVLSYQVSQRRREMGVRAALGASRGSIVRLVLWQGLGVTLLGLALGLVAALWAARLMQALLFGVTPHDAGVFGAAAAALVLVALAATLIPARRAASTDPIEALRCE